jgi:hypothetical protein
MKVYGGVDVQKDVFLTLALVGGEWLASRPGRFTPGKDPRYPLDRKLGGPQSRTGRHGEVKILATTGTLGRPARSQSLHRPRYSYSLNLKY